MALNPSALTFGTTGNTRHAKLPVTASIRALENFTWMAHVKVDVATISQFSRLYMERQGTGGLIRFAATPYKNKLRFEFSPKDGTADTNYDFTYAWDDRWHHIAFTARVSGDTPQYEIYLDGQGVAEGALVRPSGTTAISDTAPLGSIYLGNHSLHTSGGEVFDPARYWYGKVDNIYVFNEVKNQSDILAFHSVKDHPEDVETPPVVDDSILYAWRFNENTGTTTTDTKGSKVGNLFTSNAASSALWTIDRPWLGNKTEDTTAPTVPTSPVTVSTTADTAVLQWGTATDNIYVQFYSLEFDTLSNFSTATVYDNGTSGTKTIKGLINNTNYYWRVRAYDAAGNPGPYTATQSFTTPILGDITEPNRPTGLNATSVSHSSFILNWVSSTSPDVIGYKIDVAIDPNFKNYITGFRNLRVGNVNTYAITGTQPLTNYYARMRAFDEAENESIDSTVLIVQTPNRPDITPPLVVALHPASAITGTEVTLSWDEGVDDQEILSYEVDIAYDSAFTQYVTGHDGVLWQARSVGNVLGVRVQHLYPDTGYHYRVRAKDTSDNISDNPDAGVAFSTLPSSVNAGGYREYLFEPTKDTYVNSGSTSTNYGSSTTLWTFGSGAAETMISFIEFDASTIQGNIVSAMLRLYVDGASTQATNFQVATSTNAWVESTVTYTTRPTTGFSTGVVSIIPTTVGQWIDVDLTSILPSTGAGTFTIRMANLAQTDSAQFQSKENTNKPQFVVQTDITNTTTVYDMQFSEALGNRVNWIQNPAFDINTSGWVSAGAGGVTLSRLTDTPYSGTGYLNMAMTATAGTKIVQLSSLTQIPASLGETWTLTVYMKGDSANASPVLRLSERGAAGADLATSSTVTCILTTSWSRFSVTRTVTNASTQYVAPHIEFTPTLTYTIKIDQVMVEKNPISGATFNGNTPGAVWNGAAGLSTSRIGATSFSYVTPYSGDTNQNNDATTYIKYRTQSEFDLYPTTKTNNRTLKTVTTVVPPSYGPRNVIPNPSVENVITGWTTDVGTLTRTENVSRYGGACAQVTYASAGNGPFVITGRGPCQALVPLSARLDWFAPVGVTAWIGIRTFNITGTELSFSPAVVGESQLNGNGDWQTLYIPSFTPLASSASAELFIWHSTYVAGATCYMDGAQITPITGLPNYFDATFPGGIWEGAEHASTSGINLPGSMTYDVQQTFADLDGVTNSGSLATFTHNGEFIAGTFPDDLTTAGALTFTSTANAITATLPYTGDDNGDMLCRVEWKRIDLSSWSRANASIRRTSKQIVSTVPDLQPGSEYQFKITIIDPDGANNTSVGISGDKYVQANASTLTNFGTAEAPSRISFGGYLLQGRPDHKIGVTSHSGAFGLPSRRLQISDLPRGHGAVELLDLWGSRTVSLTGFIEGNSRGELDDNLQSLKQALARGRQRLTIDTLSERSRYFYGTCESFAVSEEGGNYRHLMWDAEIVCADPFGYAAELSQTNETNLVTGGQVAVYNAGDIEAEPLIRVRTTRLVPITFFIFNRNTGERIKPETTIVSSDRIVIDTTKKSVLKNGVEIEYVGSFPTLAPSDNTFQVELVSKESSASVYVELSWRARYL